MLEQVPSARSAWKSPVFLVGAAAILVGVCGCLILTATGLWLLAVNRPTPVLPDVPSSSFQPKTPPATAALLPTENPSPTPMLAPVEMPTERLSLSPTETATVVTSPTPPPGLENCASPPEGWEVYYVQPGDTLFAFVLGAEGRITTEDLRRANCLTGNLLQIGQPLYLPPGAAENAPPSDPIAPTASSGSSSGSGPRAPNCDPACTISFRPGLRAEQIAAAIDAVPVGFWGADFLAAIGPDVAVPAYNFLASRPAGRSLEGYLFPGTYQLGNADTAVSFRDMLLAAFAAALPPDADAAAAAHGLTFYQALTLASIIQRESGAYSEQVLVSSVFHNHLRAGTPFGATVTMQYALGTPANWWPRITGSQLSIASPYNTNLNAGLPPSPIDSPGTDAIRAALYPAETNYLFFTGNCHGSGNLYAATYEEHLANVNSCR